LDQLVEQARPVEEKAMVAELLAVIGGEHDDRVREDGAALQFREEPPQPEVEQRHLDVVERLEETHVDRGQLFPAVAVEARVGGGDPRRVGRIAAHPAAQRELLGIVRLPVGIVRGVRLHEVEVEEDRTPQYVPGPHESPVGARLQEHGQGHLLVGRVGIEDVEALAVPERLREAEVGGEGGAEVAVVRETLGERDLALG
jgi:hypothetical protein